jgi:hypothetical protein
MNKIKGLKLLVILAVIVGLLAGAATAKAAPPTSSEEYCLGVLSGDWIGGLCYVYNPEGCEGVEGATGYYDVISIYYFPPLVFIVIPVVFCVPFPSGQSANKDLIKGEEEGGTSSAKDWHVEYPAGACESPCRLTANGMTNAASKAGLPGMVSSAYYKTDSTDPYLICYDGGDANMLYQFVSGEWVPAPTTWYGDSICTTATGPGAFAAVSE